MSFECLIAVAAAASVGGCSCERSSSHDPDSEADRLQREGKQLIDAEQFDVARTRLTAALELHLAASDRAAASEDARIVSDAYRRQSNFPEALRWAETARVHAEAARDQVLVANALIWMGSIHYAVGDEARVDEAFDLAEPLLPAGEKSGRARLQLYRAARLDDDGRPARAEQLCKQGHELARQANDRSLIRMAINNLADIALKTGRLDEAERHLRDARAASPGPTSRGSLVNESELARLRGDLKAASAALDRAAPGAPLETQLVIARHRALIAEAGARFDDAERWWRDAVELVERIHRSMTPDQAAAAVFEDRAAPFEGLFAIQLRRRDARAAFATLVQAQGRMLLDALARSQAEMRRASRAGIDGAIGGLDLAKRLLVLLEDSSLGKPLEPRTVLATLRRRHVLAYFVGAGRLRLLAVVNGEPRVTSVNIALEDLDRLIDRRRTHPGDREAAEQLGRALLPADAMAGAPARLHIVPSGPLLRVPFSALRVGGRLLLEHHDVALAPSVSWLALQANRTDGASKGSVVVADSRSDLQQAEEEARIVSKLTGAVLHIGAGATPAALKAAAEAELLHVVSHSGVGRHGGYLRLGADEVTAADIVKWKIRPQLVVLPTCASAATERNEMWESLAAAFLAAGSAHVVATLASVEDRVAAEFTRLFYRHGGARDPVDATARALRHMAAVHTDVASWSAFVAIGP